MVVAPDGLGRRVCGDALLLIVDIDFSDPQSIDAIRGSVEKVPPALPRVFLAGAENRAIKVQANALGASEILTPPFTLASLAACIKRLAPDNGAPMWSDRPDAEREALDSATAVNESIIAAVRDARPLPRTEIARCSELVSTSLRDVGIASWLASVKQHHSYTHRHCLTVSGLAVAFAVHHGVARKEVERVATAALLHDVGKARIPLSILDKPGRLSDDERAEINLHPVYGAELLARDDQYDQGIIDIVRHHHELLDGSGYPDGLAGEEISSFVRLMTVVDIYSALIDRRSYKESLLPEEAFAILEGMEGKLDMSIVRAFKPVALHQAPEVLVDLETRVAVA